VPDRSLFEDVADALRGLQQTDFAELHCTYHRYGIKVWLGPATKAPREHYEAQVIGPQYVPQAATLGIEVGFHSEHPQEADNEAVISEPGGRQRGSHLRTGQVRTVVAQAAGRGGARRGLPWTRRALASRVRSLARSRHE
jgi:hypothetical protein